MNKTDNKNIMLVGVGGQGTLLASRILGNVLISQGYDVKVSEVHGMSQRGGSVVTYVKFGKQVYSPTIELGEADFIISFELLETARYLPYLKANGKIITNTQQIDPMPVVTGVAKYPEDIVNKIKSSGVNVLAIDALELAKQAGSQKAVNVVLMGVLSNLAGFPEQAWLDAVTKCVPPKALELNLKAFELGKNIAIS